jgi:hypothetical protein
MKRMREDSSDRSLRYIVAEWLASVYPCAGPHRRDIVAQHLEENCLCTFKLQRP